MKSAGEIAFELRLLFAGLSEVDLQVEELKRQIVNNRVDQDGNKKHLLLGGIIDKQKIIITEVKTLNREYWKAL